jgi:heat shock protein HtpX
MFYSSLSGRRYSSSSRGRGGGQAQLVMMVVAIVLAILAPIMARLLYFAISRKREYLADASAARLTRYPEGLASALEKIASSDLDLASANKVTAPMYIANPLKKKGHKLSNLTSTHPPITERIQILRSMSHGVNFLDYQKAYSVAKGKSSPIIPTSELAKTADVPIRKAFSEMEEKRGKKKEMRDLGDLMRKVNKYAFLVCVCGLKLKLPPDLKKNQIPCPRCGREIEVPLAELAAVTAAVGAQEPR